MIAAQRRGAEWLHAVACLSRYAGLVTLLAQRRCDFSKGRQERAYNIVYDHVVEKQAARW